MQYRYKQIVIVATAALLSMTSSQFQIAAGDDGSSARERARNLIERYRVSVSAIADILTYWGIGKDGTTEPRLVRWSNGPRLVLIVADGAKEEADRFVARMNDVMSAIGRRGETCMDSIVVADDGTYSPSIGELRCLQKPHEAVMIVDASSRVPKSLFREMHARSQRAGEQDAWGGLEKLDDAYFAQTSCGALLTPDAENNALRAGSAYLHAGTKGEANTRDVELCISALPFVILGQPPLHTKKPIGAMNLEFLQLYYSPDLRAGMTRGEVIGKIGN